MLTFALGFFCSPILVFWGWWGWVSFRVYWDFSSPRLLFFLFLSPPIFSNLEFVMSFPNVPRGTFRPLPHSRCSDFPNCSTWNNPASSVSQLGRGREVVGIEVALLCWQVAGGHVTLSEVGGRRWRSRVTFWGRLWVACIGREVSVGVSLFFFCNVFLRSLPIVQGAVRAKGRDHPSRRANIAPSLRTQSNKPGKSRHRINPSTIAPSHFGQATTAPFFCLPVAHLPTSPPPEKRNEIIR